MVSADLKSAQKIFEAAFGKRKASDQAVIEYLAAAQYHHFAVGDQWHEDLHLPDHILVLFQGKIRVLHQVNQHTHQPLSMFLPCDLVDGHLFANRQVHYLGSEEGFFCHVPKRLVEESDTLTKCYADTSERLGDALHLLDLSQKTADSSFSSSPNRLGTEVNGKSRSGPSGALIKEAVNQPHEEIITSVSDVLKLIVDHYKPQIPSSMMLDEVLHTPAQLFGKLQQLGLVANPKPMTWNELLHAPFPFLLYDKERVRWVIGKKGNSLVVLTPEGIGAYMPETINLSTRLNACFITRQKAQPRLKSKAHKKIPLTLDWYADLLKEYWPLSLQMAFSSIIVQFFALANPIFLMVIFDRVFGRQNMSALEIMTIGVVLVSLFELMIRFFRSHILAYQLEQLDRVTIKALIERFFSVPLLQNNAELIRAFIEKFGDVVRVNHSFLNLTLVSSFDVLFSVIILGYLFVLNFQLAFISVLSIVPLILVSVLSAPRLRHRQKLFLKDQRLCQIKLNEFAQGHETVKSLNATKVMKSQLDAFAVEHLVERAGRVRFDRASQGVWNTFFTNIGYLFVLYCGAQEVLSGTITYGVYMAVNMLSRRVMSNFQQLVASYLEFQESASSAEQIKPLFELDDEYTNQSQDGVFLTRVEGRLCFHDVSFRYSPEHPWVLKDINLAIEPGEKVILTGKSGSGKSTFIRLAQRMVNPETGYITLDGFNTADFDLDNLRGLVGALMQRPTLFQGTLRENIALGRSDAPMNEIVQAATMSELDSYIVKLPMGFDHEVQPMGLNLSGGQIARIALARVLLLKPSILILDETLNAVEPSLRAAIFKKIMEAYKHQTCIFVTDYVPLHQRADRIIVLDDGQIVEQGSYDELMALKGYYFHLSETDLSLLSPASKR